LRELSLEINYLVASGATAGYLFVHLPKTAGTSFSSALQSALGRDAVSPLFVASRLSEQDIARLERYRAIAGHISIDDITPFRNRQLLTILRDPTDRCISWYYFAHRQNDRGQTPEVRAAQDCTIDEFFCLDLRIIFRNIFNRQVRQLGGHILDSEIDLSVALCRAKTTLREAAWVGRTETLSADLVRLRRRFSEFSQFELPELNATQGRKAVDALDPQIIQQVRSLNAYDAELYCFATEEIAAGRLG
jgi:Sulfotransferase family